MRTHSLAFAAVGAALMFTPAAAVGGPDDQPDTCGAARPWPLAEFRSAVTGRLEGPGDVDAFVLVVEPGTLYRFNRWIGDCGACPRARVFQREDCDREFAGIDGFLPLGQDWFIGPADGRVPMLVDYPAGGWGDYLVRIDRIGGPVTDHHGGTPAFATPVRADGSVVRGALEFGLDADTFVLEARPGAMYAVRAVSGIGPGPLAHVVFGPLFREGKPMLVAQLPEDGCDSMVNGCGVARMIAPEGEPSLLYITVRQDSPEDATQPAVAYSFEVVDEGDFVPTPSGAECTDAPSTPAGQPIRVALPDTPFQARTYTLPANGAGSVYRFDVINEVGAANYSFGVSDGLCSLAGSCCGDVYNPRLYLRAANNDPKQLLVYRDRQALDVYGLAIPGWCQLQVTDLGRIPDAEVDDAPTSAGGRILAGTLEYGGDEDTFVTDVSAGVWYRVELRLLTPGKSAAAYAFGPGAVVSMVGSGPAVPGSVPTFRSANFRSNQGGLVRLYVGRSERGEEIATRYELRMYRRDCRGDWNNSGSVNIEDVYAYLSDFAGGFGEFDGVGSRPSVGDLLGFLQSYFGTCE